MCCRASCAESGRSSQTVLLLTKIAINSSCSADLRISRAGTLQNGSLKGALPYPAQRLWGLSGFSVFSHEVPRRAWGKKTLLLRPATKAETGPLPWQRYEECNAAMGPLQKDGKCCGWASVDYMLKN